MTSTTVTKKKNTFFQCGFFFPSKPERKKKNRTITSYLPIFWVDRHFSMWLPRNKKTNLLWLYYYNFGTYKSKTRNFRASLQCNFEKTVPKITKYRRYTSIILEEISQKYPIFEHHYILYLIYFPKIAKYSTIYYYVFGTVFTFV